MIGEIILEALAFIVLGLVCWIFGCMALFDAEKDHQ